jgi:hypothetical protein
MKILHIFRLLVGMCCVVLACLAMATSAYASFGLQSFNFSVNEAPPVGSEPGTLGPPDVQAGSHPFQMTTSFSMNQTTDSEEKPISEGAVKDVYMELPPGMVGDPTAVPQCSPKLLANGGLLGGEGCPASTQIGTVTLDTTLANLTVPVFNLVPPPGVLAQFGFNAISEVTMDVSVRSGSDYGVTVGFHNLSEVLPVEETSLTLWGVPADPAHDPFRGSCLSLEGGSNGSCPTHAVPNAFLTLPTSCTESLKTMIKVDSWESPGVFVEKEAANQVGEVFPVGLLGCDRLTFAPTVNVQTEATAADSPTGLLIDVSIPQNNNPEGLAEPDLKDTVMTLPAGLSINPATADGLTGCAPSQIGLESTVPPTCPDASKIGAVEIDTPLLAHPLLGSIYLAQPSNNPFGGLLAVYVAAQENGIVAKLAGRLTADPSTGQLTMSLDNVPELPFSDLKLHLFGGQRAALASPSSCGSFTTTTQMTPYSAPDSGAAATPSSTFAIDENCGGGFSPTLVAGATSASAGQSTNFTLQVSRADGQQYIKSLTTTLPPGLFAGLNAVPRCGEAQAMEGTCEAASRVGSMVIAAGSGSHPYYLNGQVFLTGPYDGAPFGMSIVTPAVAGPFNLGTVIVRAGISVNSNDAHLTIRTDALPTILEGIPLRVKAAYLTIDRSGFMFNPTDCSVQAINAAVASTEGADAAISTPFTVSGCSKLPFAPSLTASTQAKVSGRIGASLRVKLSYPSGDANVKSVKIQLPKQLPAELKTLQKACTEAVFAANPTSCPKESQVGSGIVRTPIFANPLKGVTYLVSHGDEAFPSLVVVLRGEGVTLDMRGVTNIHKGILTTTFMTVPDMPISTFELSLPQGPFPVFGPNLLAKAHGSFCSSNLVLPTTILGQNGAKFTQQTKIRVIGCHKVKKAVHPKA